MAMLAPDIIERISKGEHPPQLTAKKLIGHLLLPADWGEQRKRLGPTER
jgi:ABC-type enterobactin transport system permease subunit